MNSDLIVSVAIRTKDGLVYSLPRPNRHYNIITMMIASGIKDVSDGIQGFLLANGRFVNRYKGAEIAFETGQIKEKVSELYSESLWE